MTLAGEKLRVESIGSKLARCFRNSIARPTSTAMVGAISPSLSLRCLIRPMVRAILTSARRIRSSLWRKTIIKALKVTIAMRNLIRRLNYLREPASARRKIVTATRKGCAKTTLSGKESATSSRCGRSRRS